MGRGRERVERMGRGRERKACSNFTASLVKKNHPTIFRGGESPFFWERTPHATTQS